MNRQERRRLEREAEKTKQKKLDNDIIDPNPGDDVHIHFEDVRIEEPDKNDGSLGEGTRRSEIVTFKLDELKPRKDGLYYIEDAVLINGQSIQTYWTYIKEASSRFERYAKEILTGYNLLSQDDNRIIGQKAVALIDNEYEETCFWIMISDIMLQQTNAEKVWGDVLKKNLNYYDFINQHPEASGEDKTMWSSAYCRLLEKSINK